MAVNISFQDVETESARKKASPLPSRLQYLRAVQETVFRAACESADTQDINKHICNSHSPPTSVVVVLHGNPTARPGRDAKAPAATFTSVGRVRLHAQPQLSICTTHLKITNHSSGPSRYRRGCQPPGASVNRRATEQQGTDATHSFGSKLQFGRTDDATRASNRNGRETHDGRRTNERQDKSTPRDTHAASTRDAMQTRRGVSYEIARTRTRCKTRPTDTVARAILPLTARGASTFTGRSVARNFAPLLRAGESARVPAARLSRAFFATASRDYPTTRVLSQLSITIDILLLLFLAILCNYITFNIERLA